MTEPNQPERAEPVKIHASLHTRSLSVEVRSAVGWLTWIFGTVAWAFGMIDTKAALAALVASSLLGLSTIQPKP